MKTDQDMLSAAAATWDLGSPAHPHRAHPPPALPPTCLLWEETSDPRRLPLVLALPRGTTLRLTAQGDGANLSLVLYNARQKLERYNMPDSLKAQHTAHYTRGHVLMSDMGCAMASITADSLGWHDPLGLLLDAERMHAKYGEHGYQQHRNGMYRSGKRRPADRDRQVRPDPARPGGTGELLQQGQRGR
jgi:uncharacterized protein YcgI (DUF1989 family)